MAKEEKRCNKEIGKGGGRGIKGRMIQIMQAVVVILESRYENCECDTLINSGRAKVSQFFDNCIFCVYIRPNRFFDYCLSANKYVANILCHNQESE